MLYLLLSKLLKIIILDQMINMAAFFLILVKITIGVPTFYTKINISFLLLKYTKLIGNLFLVC